MVRKIHLDRICSSHNLEMNIIYLGPNGLTFLKVGPPQIDKGSYPTLHGRINIDLAHRS